MLGDQEILLDEFIAASATGRHLAYFRGGDLRLLDSITRSEINISGKRRAEGEWLKPATVLRGAGFRRERTQVLLS